MDAVERLDQLAAATVALWAATFRNVWRRACEHDGIDPGARFISFSATNPFVPFADTAFEKWREARAGNRVVGYVGLEIGKDGEAVIPENIVREAARLERQWERQARDRERAAIVARLGTRAKAYVQALLQSLREERLWAAALAYTTSEEEGKVAPLYPKGEDDGQTAYL